MHPRTPITTARPPRAEVLVKSLDDFVPHFVKCWFDDATAPPSPGAKCAIGIGKSKLYFLDDPRHAAAAPGDTSGRSVGTAFAELMMIGDCTEWFAPVRHFWARFSPF